VATDCNICNPAAPDYDQPFCASVGQAGGICQAPAECVHLEWRPTTIGASGPGQIINLPLYAVSSTGFDLPFEALDVVLNWDPTKLRLIGKQDPCTISDPCTETCPVNTYKWFSSVFPNDCNLDSINTPCPGDPENDGDAWYQAASQFVCNLTEPAPPATATPSGLKVTTFKFEVLADVGTCTEVDMPFSPQTNTHTRVVGIHYAGEIVTGEVSPPVTVCVEECAPPTVLAVGSKVIEVDPGTTAGSFGINVSSDSPGVTCMNRYAQADGKLGPGAVYQTAAEWGNQVRLRDRYIIPDLTYHIRKDCGSAGNPSFSSPVDVTMKMWADTDDSLVIDFKDIARTVDGFLGNFAGQDPPLTFADVDLVGITDPNPALSKLVYCAPNNFVDFKDIAIVVEAFVLSGSGTDAYTEICDIDFCSGQ